MTAKIDMLLKVCDLYYNQRFTQAEIARKLDSSRTTISRILDEAREEGYVQINILAPLKKNEVLASKLKRKYSLKNAIVFENIGEYSFDLENLGKTIANYVNSIVKKNYTIGISWGKAMESFVTNMSHYEWKNCRIVQINGSLGSDGNAMDASEIAIRLGQQTNSHYELLSAPAFVDSKNLQNELLNQTQIKKVIALADEYDISISGIGNLKQRYNTIYLSGVVTKRDLNILKEHGAVGHIAGRMYDKDGNEVLIEDQWPISPSIGIFKNVLHSIGCAIGEDRSEAVKGAIKGELINTLICDAALAKKILNDD